MMVMRRRARHVSVLASRQIDPFDDAELGQQFERSEQRGPAHSEPSVASRGLELQGREVSAVGVNQTRYRATWSGQLIAGEVEGVDDGVRLVHVSPS